MDNYIESYLDSESEDYLDEATPFEFARRKALARARLKRSPLFGRTTTVRPAKTTKEAFNRVGDDMKKTRSAIQNIDLDNKVTNDLIASRIKMQSQRINRTENAIALSHAINAVISQINIEDKKLPWLKPVLATLPGLSTLFLRSDRRGFSNPQIWGPISSLVASGLTAWGIHLANNQSPKASGSAGNASGSSDNSDGEQTKAVTHIQLPPELTDYVKAHTAMIVPIANQMPEFIAFIKELLKKSET